MESGADRCLRRVRETHSHSKPKVFALDAHIEPLLALPATVSLPTISAYQDGRLLAQDKASCMPAWVLLTPVLADAEEGLLEEKGKGKGVRVLDATAAPGNKTTMAAALVADERINGRVVACERDQGRFKVLKDMLKRADAKSECFRGSRKRVRQVRRLTRFRAILLPRSQMFSR